MKRLPSQWTATHTNPYKNKEQKGHEAKKSPNSRTNIPGTWKWLGPYFKRKDKNASTLWKRSILQSN